MELYKISIEHNICGLKHPAEKIIELARYKYWHKMVDYLKKALIYGHTSRISS